LDEGTTVLDQMGGILKNRFGTKTPAALIEPVELAVGKRWRIAYKNMWPGVVVNNFYDFQVVGVEDVTVPAGTMNLLRRKVGSLAVARCCPSPQPRDGHMYFPAPLAGRAFAQGDTAR